MSVDVKQLEVGQDLPGLTKRMTIEQMSLPLWSGGNKIHFDEEFARAQGLPGPIATGEMSVAYISEMLTRAFGADWVRGGRISFKFVRSLYAGDTVAVRGRVTGRHPTHSGTRFDLDVWCENQDGATVTAGEASVIVTA
ncbi:MAG TPA: MaoC family dehydratase [Dehalococcoidia bacterium]|nr:MaoC family dehydratase [Dehalococcoidia bacterium]